jgi:hypothetical protein
MPAVSDVVVWSNVAVFVQVTVVPWVIVTVDGTNVNDDVIDTGCVLAAAPRRRGKGSTP